MNTDRPDPPEGTLQHPVPPNVLAHIGDVTVSFAVLEMCLQRLIWLLMGTDQRIGQVVTAELAFKNLRALAISLYRERHEEEDADFDTLKDLVKRAAFAEEKRNQIIHSAWGVGATGDAATRFKTTAKEKRGLHTHIEQVSETDLSAVALELRRLAADYELYMYRWLMRQRDNG